MCRFCPTLLSIKGIRSIESEYIENTNIVAKAIKVATATFIAGKL